ncbi:MAG TPA: hypothetical protein VF941_03045 [Clostridia bacterium]
MKYTEIKAFQRLRVLYFLRKILEDKYKLQDTHKENIITQTESRIQNLSLEISLLKTQATNVQKEIAKKVQVMIRGQYPSIEHYNYAIQEATKIALEGTAKSVKFNVDSHWIEVEYEIDKSIKR